MCVSLISEFDVYFDAIKFVCLVYHNEMPSKKQRI